MPSTKLAAQLKRKQDCNYEEDTPRCYNCAFRGWNNAQHPICKKHAFSNEPGGICDDWTGKDGTKLEKD